METILIQTQEYQRKDSNGYVSILTDSGWIKEHIWIIEKFLNRKLEPNECVHHIDGCKQNNNIYNLCLFTKSQHSHFHRQVRQFKMTRPRLTEIRNNIIQVKLRELQC